MMFSIGVSRKDLIISATKSVELSRSYVPTTEKIEPAMMDYERDVLKYVARRLEFYSSMGDIDTELTTSTRYMHDIGGKRNQTEICLKITVTPDRVNPTIGMEAPLWICLLTQINATMTELGIKTGIIFSELASAGQIA